MKKAFTIIETLVAITILMIAISGPLTVAFNGLTAAVDARNQFIASFLAQDAVEYIRNLKDTNILTDDTASFLRGIDTCTSAAPCAVDVVQETLAACTADCTLYLDSSGNYTTVDTDNLATNFRRYAYIQNATPSYGQLVVRVAWNTGAYGENDTTIKLDLYDVTK